MSRSALLGNTFLAVTAAICVPIFLAACYAVRYPTIRYVPGVTVGVLPSEVRCFRVEACVENATGVFWPKDRPGQVLTGSFVLTEIPVSPHGNVNGQARVALDYSWNGLYGSGTDRHVVLLHLYRPGYQLVEIPAEKDLDTVVWTEASGLESQEKAVDDLLSVVAVGPKEGLSHYLYEGPLQFASGSDNPRHKRALLFAASEYERLARDIDSADAARRELGSRLQDKSKWIRDWAEKGLWAPVVSLSASRVPSSLTLSDSKASKGMGTILLTAFP